ncbi:MAG TPA: DUF1634 domain-containing protein [Gemmatimonadales bacterium]|nr:DUF1634 domain-containing protein [Gemmatimonadales bacterium]
MTAPDRAMPESDPRLQHAVGKLLRFGVLLAAAVVLVGGIAYLARYGAAVPDYRVFRGQPDNLRSLAGIVRSAFALDERGVIQLGLVLLVATPIARVAIAGFVFAFERDRTYVLVALLVLALLLWSLIG